MKNSTLAVFLNLGESFASLGGQAELMISQNIAAFAKAFKRIYVFTYNQESVKLPPNCILITPPRPLHRYLYALLLPFIHGRIIRQCQVLRCFQLSGTVPAIVAKLIYGSKFVFNYGYDYAAFARLEGKALQARSFSLLSLVAVKFAAGVIVKNKGLKIKGHYLPNGVDIHQFAPKPKSNSKIKTVLFIGRLEPQKNLAILLTALAQAKRKLKIIFVGQGSQKQILISQAKTLKLNLTIRDNLTHSQLPKLYQSTDVFVLPSLIEGSPKVLLEAMACGLPVVATAVPGITEIIKSKVTGVLVKPTVAGLTSGINYVISHPQQARRLGIFARRRIQAEFGITQVMNQEIAILKSV